MAIDLNLDPTFVSLNQYISGRLGSIGSEDFGFSSLLPGPSQSADVAGNAGAGSGTAPNAEEAPGTVVAFMGLPVWAWLVIVGAAGLLFWKAR